MRRFLRIRFLLVVFALVAAAFCVAQSAGDLPGLSLTTPDRLQDKGWWPTKGGAAASAYAGEAACLQCHAGIAATQHLTPMYHAAVRASASLILAQRAELTYHDGLFTQTVRRTADGAVFTVSDGRQTAAQSATWAMGAGEVGQTYILESEGRFTEGRVSYYTSLEAADITTGQSADASTDMEKAFGQVLKGDNAQHCFSCHTTRAVVDGRFDVDHAVPGVTCEACHGPGARHVAAMTAGRLDEAGSTIANPARMSPTDSVDFCGACHRTASDVNLLLPPNMGVVVARFQPYRLEKSRCWGEAGDQRITCIACHDPHKPLVRDVAAYDSKCLACHAGGGRAVAHGAAAPACKVATHDCASCHMPKYEIPQTHAKFTDHYIRVVRAGETFPQ